MRPIRASFERLAGCALLAVVLATTAARADDDDDDAVQQLLNRIEIDNLLVRYTHALDTLNADAYANVFAADAVFEIGGDEVRRGRDEIRSIITGLQESRAERAAAATDDAPETLMHHVMSNATLEIVSDHEAHHYAYWMTILGNTEDGFRVASMGHYEDVLMKHDGEWLIQHRKLLR
jgi:uncharacterized protein (TIGR02246 family)